MRQLILAFVLLCVAAPLAAEESQFISRARQLTLEGRRAGEGYFHPDGTKIIFQSEREAGNPFYQIYILDLESGETHRVSPGMGKTTCAFFRPGTDRVLFASTHLDPASPDLQKQELEDRASGRERRYAWDYDPHFDIFDARQDGSEIRRLTSAEGYDAEASYSPDGTKIAFSSNRTAYPAAILSEDDKKRLETDAAFFGEIYIMNADGAGQTRLTTEPGYDGGPFFTPDGERIVWRRFSAADGGLTADIYTMKLDGSDAKRLTEFGSMSWAPYFHPSGDYAIFASNKLGFENFELFMVDCEGTREPVRVTTTAGFDGLPVFSPDGNKLLWTSTRHGGGRNGGQLYFGNWNHEAAKAAITAAPPRGSARVAAADKSEKDANPHAAPAAASAPKAAAYDEARIKANIEYLAGEKLEGRLTGAEGERLAGERIADEMKSLGLVPLPGDSDYFTTFTFTSGFSLGANNKFETVRIPANPHMTDADRLKQGAPLGAAEADKDFRPLAMSEEGAAEGILAFAGYGLVVPGEAGNFLYNSYDKLDVTGKIVVVLRYVPEDVPPETRQIYNRYAGLRFKALQAREHGAVAMLVVTGPRSPNAGELIPLGLDAAGFSSGIRAASISGALADRLFESSEKKLEELQKELDSGEPKEGFVIEDRAARIEIDLNKETRTGRNVIGMLPPSAGLAADSGFVVIGAHYDHLGRGGDGSSLARKGEENAVHFGADDNASGTAALLEIAASFAASPRPRARGIIFAAWSGEEIGLLGSAAFVKHPPVELPKIAGYLNMDMIGRLREDKLIVQGVGSSADWKGVLERKNVSAGFALSVSDDPYLPTDSTSFYLQQVPGLHFFSGAHEDYHRPTDTAEKINVEGLVRIGKFVEAIARDLAEKPDFAPAYAKVERAANPAEGGRDTLRAFLGTIPDYAEEVKGVKLSGVSGGGPADKAGLKGGDVIIELAGQKIANIYDYTYALDAVKIGQEVEIAVQRGEEVVRLKITPEARK